jgi:putative transposase
MQAFKTVKQVYTPPSELLNLLDEFRRMVNNCVRIGLAENISSMKALSKKCYHELTKYNVPTRYCLTAISKAASILRNYRHSLRKNPMAKKPYASKPFLTDCYAFRVVDGRLKLPIRPTEYIFVPLNTYVLRSIMNYTLHSVCLTPYTISLSFSKEVNQIEPVRLVGIDRNLDNVTVGSSINDVKKYDLSRASEVIENCRQIKRGLRRNDYRIRKEIYSKYGRIERNRVNSILHNVSIKIVRAAKEKQFGIVMENLKDTRKLYRHGNGQGSNYRAKMNCWSYAELQRQVEYKARWEGIPVFYIQPSRTSSTCAMCGSHIAECSGRKVYCLHCKTLLDRDENAALNIANAGLRFSPKWVSGEAMKGNPMSGRKVILRADDTQLPSQPNR